MKCILVIGTPMTRMVLQTYLESGLVWTGGVFNDLYSNLEYEFRLVCGPHYFGIDCDTFCRPRDDPLGHFTCGPEGQKVCMNGYEKNPNDPEGDYCTQGNGIKWQLIQRDDLILNFIAILQQFAVRIVTWNMDLAFHLENASRSLQHTKMDLNFLSF